MLKMIETKTSSNNITEQTSNIYLSKEDIEKIKARVIANVVKVLPDILAEIIPLIVEESQILINIYLEELAENYQQTAKKVIIPTTMLMIFFFATKLNGFKSYKNIKIVITSFFDVIN